MKTMKIVVVGDGRAGKTSLAMRCTSHEFPEFPDAAPKGANVVFKYLHTAHNGEVIEVGLWDTPGTEEYDRLRPLNYPGAEVFFICVNVLGDLRAITDEWYPEVQHFCPDVPVIIVGTKSDLRDKINTKDLLLWSNRIPFTLDEVECSALDGFNVHEVVEIGIRAVSQSIRRPSSSSSKTLTTIIKKFKSSLGIGNNKNSQMKSTERFFEVLPRHISLLVIGSLDLADIYRFGLACRATHELAEEPLLWIQLCQKRDSRYKFISPLTSKRTTSEYSGNKNDQMYLAPKKYMERCVKSVWINPFYKPTTV